MLRAALLFFLASWLPATSYAHQKSVSYSKWTLVDGGAVAEARVRWLELTSVRNLEDEPFESASIVSYLQERLTLEADAGVCAPKPGSEIWLPAEQGWARLDELAQGAYEHLEACPCSDGCPSCVGMPILRVAQQQDPDLGQARAIPGKAAARALLQHWLQQLPMATEGEIR